MSDPIPTEEGARRQHEEAMKAARAFGERMGADTPVVTEGTR